MTNKGYFLLVETLNKFGPNVIDLVVTEKDPKIHKDYYNEITQLCLENQIKVVKRTDAYTIQTKYALAVSWQWLIKLNQDKKLIVFHDSLLPKYRGFAPLVNSLINKEPQIGVTALFASAEYDRGEVIAQAASKISYPIRIEEAIQINNLNYSSLALLVIQKIINGESIKSTPQDEKLATYSLWRDEDDYRINWQESSEDIIRFINATNFPYKGASALLNNKIVRILEAEEEPDVIIENRTPGKIIFSKEGFPVIVCGEGLIRLKQLVDDQSQSNLLPLKKFRIKFQ